MKIDYVVVGSDNNPLYLDFWPVISKVWKLKFNITPVLGLICDEDSDFIEDEFGLIKKIKSVTNFSTSLQSQLIRFYLPSIINGCTIISDIDMIPLSKKYFVDDVKNFDDDKFIIFSSHNDQTFKTNQYPACYVAGNQNMYQEIFGTFNSFESFLDSVTYNSWCTDQIHLYEMCQRIDRSKLEFPERVWGNNCARIDRSKWSYDESLVKNDYYIDCHSLRPYNQYKNEIDQLINLTLNT
jgi:hypothetical protein